MDYWQFRLRSFTVLHSKRALHCGSDYELPRVCCADNPTDSDIIFYCYDICAIPFNRNPPKNTSCTVLRIDSRKTPPGYATLMIDRGSAEDKPTFYRRPTMLRNIETGGPSMIHEDVFTPIARERFELTRCGVSKDQVFAIYCPYWPAEAKEWRKRQRFHGWPNEKLIARITRGGCHFVSKLRTWSTSDDTEWRFSFSKAELLLIHSWTKVQKLVYHVTRKFKRNISEYCGGGENKGLQTYYFKTLMFWACEEFPQELWTEENMNICVETILRRFFRCLDEKYCPSYFISNCNIMSHLKEEGSFEKELQALQILLGNGINIVFGNSPNQLHVRCFELPFEYVCLSIMTQLFPINEYLNGRMEQYLAEGEWFLTGMKNIHAAIEAHLRLMSLDSVNERQRSSDYIKCLENFDCALLCDEEFEPYEGSNPALSINEIWLKTLIRKQLRKSSPIYRRKSHLDDMCENMLKESFPSLLHSLTSAYRANFYFTAMQSYDESLDECDKCFEVLKRVKAVVIQRKPSELSSHIPLLICNKLSQIFDEDLQVILGFATLHRNISSSNSTTNKLISTHEVCLKLNAWEFLKYIYIQCEQRLSSISEVTVSFFHSLPILDFDRPCMSLLTEHAPFSAAILFAALRQSRAYKEPLKGNLIPYHFRKTVLTEEDLLLLRP